MSTENNDNKAAFWPTKSATSDEAKKDDAIKDTDESDTPKKEDIASESPNEADKDTAEKTSADSRSDIKKDEADIKKDDNADVKKDEETEVAEDDENEDIRNRKTEKLVVPDQYKPKNAPQQNDRPSQQNKISAQNLAEALADVKNIFPMKSSSEEKEEQVDLNNGSQKTELLSPVNPNEIRAQHQGESSSIDSVKSGEAAPDQSKMPVIPKSEFKRTLIFDKEENRWEDAQKYELPVVGDKVGCYKILSELGRGGFGAVYKAKNLTLGREEALKLILPSAKSECEDIEKRFEREIDIVSRLEHPNIVRLYSSGTLAHSIVWMTMELVRGDRLDDRLAKNGAMKFKQAQNITAQLLCGLEEAHRHQIVHRDLKPANIMLSQKEGYADQVVILDFGLSKALGESEDSAVQELTQVDSRRVYGTPQYMAPEQLNKGKLGPWTDVYAAGLIFFELLTGHPAVEGESIFDIAFKQSYDPLVVPRIYEDTAVEAVLLKACAKNPADRYKDAGEFFDALQHIEDETDPVSVIRNENRSGRSLASIDMLNKTRDDISQMKTQMKLSTIEPPVKHTECTGAHARMSGGMCFLLVFFILLAVLFICVLVAYALGFIDIVVKL